MPLGGSTDGIRGRQRARRAARGRAGSASGAGASAAGGAAASGRGQRSGSREDRILRQRSPACSAQACGWSAGAAPPGATSQSATSDGGDRLIGLQRSQAAAAAGLGHRRVERCGVTARQRAGRGGSGAGRVPGRPVPVRRMPTVTAWRARAAAGSSSAGGGRRQGCVERYGVDRRGQRVDRRRRRQGRVERGGRSSGRQRRGGGGTSPPSSGLSSGAASATTLRGVALESPRPHTGHAPRPWVASTRSATAICSSLVAMCAAGAYSPPPWPDQVLGENCSPPW